LYDAFFALWHRRFRVPSIPHDFIVAETSILEIFRTRIVINVAALFIETFSSLGKVNFSDLILSAYITVISKSRNVSHQNFIKLSWDIYNIITYSIIEFVLCNLSLYNPVLSINILFYIIGVLFDKEAFERLIFSFNYV